MRVSNNKTPILRFISLVFLSLFFTTGAYAADKEKKTDLRVLVDVSGSMKQNDPENLRRTALRLLIGLVPEETRVGMWSFGQYVNMQVKPEFASKAWKKNARLEAEKIHSHGLFTDIEATLDKSTWDWRKPDPAWDRHLILLTDGQVDISKNKSKNSLSRGKILKDLLPNLKAAGVKIHTIALSKNADHKLLKTLSTESDAWYEPVESAARLQKVFLKLFEKSTPTDNLPLEGNRFEVDKSIEDMTLLVFHKQDAKPTRIIRPDNSSFQYGQVPKNVSWHHDKGFDLITVHKPATGAWLIDAEIDNDNRVQVVTNLKLRVGDIPNNVLRNESIAIHAELKEKGGLVSSKEILELVDMSVASKQADKAANYPMQSTEVAGRYSTEVRALDETGVTELVVRAVGPTFRRESRHTVRVHENPLRLDISENGNVFLITVTENQDLVQAGSLQLALQFEGDKAAYHVPKADAHRWQAMVGSEYAGRKLSIQANAHLLNGRTLATVLHGQLPEAEVTFSDPLNISAEEENGNIVVQVSETPGVLQMGTLKLKLLLPDIDNVKVASSHELLQVEPYLWHFPVDSSYSGIEVTIQASAYILNGKTYESEYKLVLPRLKHPVEENKPAEELVSEEPVEVHIEEKKGRNWLLIITSLVLINGLIGVGGFFAYRYWKRRDNQVDDELGSDEENPEMDVKTDDVEVEEEEISFDEDVDIIQELSVDEEPPVPSAEDKKVKEDFVDERRPQPASPEVDLSEPEELEEDNEEIPTLTEATQDDIPAAGVAAGDEAGSDEAVADEWAAALAEAGDTPAAEDAAVDAVSSDEAVADEWAAALAEAGDTPAAEDAAVDAVSSDEAVADEWAAALAEAGDTPAAEDAVVDAVSSDEAVADEWAAALAEAGDTPAAEEIVADEASSDEAVADEWAAALSEAGVAPDGTVDDSDTDKSKEEKT